VLGVSDRVGAVAQQTSKISEERLCDACSLALRPVATIGGALGDPASPRLLPVTLARLHDGGYATAAISGDEILLYDRAGQFTRSIGRNGRGPGEFQFIWTLYAPVGSGDLIVFDYALGRATVLDPGTDSAKKLLTGPVPRATDLVRMDDGTLVVAADVRTRDAAGLPLHVLDARGRIRKSFGAIDLHVNDERPSLTKRHISRDESSGSLWAIRPDRYVLERWDTTGRRMSVRQRDVDWFPPRDFEQSEPDRPPQPYIIDIEIESEIWILIRVPDSQWTPRPEHTPTDWDRLDREFDSIIEVLTTDGRFVRLHRRFDEALDGLLSGGQAFRRGVDLNGTPVIHVFDVIHTQHRSQP
jgi:hypothetical protein